MYVTTLVKVEGRARRKWPFAPQGLMLLDSEQFYAPADAKVPPAIKPSHAGLGGQMPG